MPPDSAGPDVGVRDAIAASDVSSAIGEDAGNDGAGSDGASSADATLPPEDATPDRETEAEAGNPGDGPTESGGEGKGDSGGEGDSGGGGDSEGGSDSDSEGGSASDGGEYTIGPTPICGEGADISGASLVLLEGGLRQIVIDPCHAHVYVSDGVGNQIDDYSVASASLLPPIAVGSEPNGFDITPDGRRLYTANSGATNISVVDLGSRAELKKLNFSSNFAGDTPLSLAIAKNGKAFFSTTFGGSGFGGRLMSLDLASEAIAPATSFYIDGETTEATVLKASADHSAIGIVAGDISSAPVFLYKTSTGTFSPEHDLNGFISQVSVSPDGSQLLVDGTFMLDDNLNLLGTISGADTPWATFAPSGKVAYRSATDHIDILDTTRFLVTGSIPVTADTLQGTTGSNVGNLVVSSDGLWLAMISDHGITFVPVP